MRLRVGGRAGQGRVAVSALRRPAALEAGGRPRRNPLMSHPNPHSRPAGPMQHVAGAQQPVLLKFPGTPDCGLWSGLS